MKLIEVFNSIQGEGRFIGEPTTFVRLAGCNMRCSWCDTKESWGDGEEKTVENILKKVEASGIKNVCVTGGEPLLQKDELLELMNKLKNLKLKVTLETNGSLHDAEVFALADSVACDMKPPSSGEKSDESILGKLEPKDFVKIVVADDADLQFAEKIITKSKAEVFLQPAEAGKLKWLAQQTLERKLRARVLPQLHKIIKVK